MSVDGPGVDTESAEYRAAVEARSATLLAERVGTVIEGHPGLLRYDKDNQTLENRRGGELAIRMNWGPTGASEGQARGVFVPTVEQCEIMATVAEVVLPPQGEHEFDDRAEARFGVPNGAGTRQHDKIIVTTDALGHWLKTQKEVLPAGSHFTDLAGGTPYELIVSLCDFEKGSKAELVTVA